MHMNIAVEIILKKEQWNDLESITSSRDAGSINTYPRFIILIAVLTNDPIRKPM